MTTSLSENTLKKCFEILHEDKAALPENKKSYFEVRFVQCWIVYDINIICQRSVLSASVGVYYLPEEEGVKPILTLA